MRYEGLGSEFSQPIRYRIIRELAAGGMGRVLEAEQYGADGFSKRVAIKVVHRQFGSSPEFIQMFIGEARLVAELIHPNIVQIYQMDVVDDTYYIVMELIRGSTLERFLELHRQLERPVPPELATFIVSRVARGLEYAHKKKLRGRRLNVVHRDVSPKNILITEEGEVKLGDFGVAKAATFLELPEGEQVFGKVEYMSPEQASCQETGPRSDLYSLGLVYYELLAGYNPMRLAGDSFQDTLLRVLSGEVPPLPGLAPKYGRILERVLQRDPSRRYPDAGKLGRALEMAIYGKGYGPTIVALRRYIKALAREALEADGEPQRCRGAETAESL